MTMHFRTLWIATLLSLSQASFAESPTATESVDLDNASEIQKLSYLLGVDMYEKRSRQGFTLDADMVAQAIRDEQTGQIPSMSTAEYMRMVTIKREKIAEFEARWQLLSQKNLAEGKAFMEKKALEPGVMSTDSGLLYKILRQGTGPRPTVNDIARAHYRGTLLSGEEFDSSFKRGKPLDFPVGKVRPAMKEILTLMREGAKWVFYAPPHLGYGEEGAGPIGPNETLTTEVELIEILK
jgi:FKBP-type peptidyl-prolyl cis-trans isomerase